MAFMLPRITNFLSASRIHARNSRNREKGGFVMMMSASSRSLLTSSLLKSPSPSRYPLNSMSSVSTIPEPSVSLASVNSFPCVSCLDSS